ncbi:MAG TPA: 50S ribosomal protein L11 methyltransferase [Rhodanobacteraceae bacterium]|nr:50S ribosomal protein L11 methyltransferase [Rhodanobacteraceae bacterium]
MPYLALDLALTADRQAETEAALEALGALSVTLADAAVDTPDEQAIFEPGVGETPLWGALTLEALFDAGTDRDLLQLALQAQLPWLAANTVAFRTVEDQDWERAWMDQFQPMRFGRRLWVYPWNIEPPDDGSVIVRLDPGLAFGTGTHPTTALCLAWLDSLDLAGKTLIDYGCGSGVLAIAALKLGAASAAGIDNDPQALVASHDNATRNDVAERLTVALPGKRPAPADVFVANILAGPLAELAPLFASLCKPGAPFAISGILDGQQGELLDGYAAAGFEQLVVTMLDGWVRIDGQRRGT